MWVDMIGVDSIIFIIIIVIAFEIQVIKYFVSTSAAAASVNATRGVMVSLTPTTHLLI